MKSKCKSYDLALNQEIAICIHVLYKFIESLQCIGNCLIQKETIYNQEKSPTTTREIERECTSDAKCSVLQNQNSKGECLA